MWKLYVQFLTFPSHDLPQSESRSGKRHSKWESSLPDAMGSTCARTNSSPQPALGQGQSVCKCCHDLTTSETALCSCRVRTDPERDGKVPRNVIPERRVRIWQEGHPSPCQEPREEGSVSAAAAQPSFWLRPGTPVASLGKGPLLHPRPCSCCQHQIPLPAPDPSASTCSPATPPGCHRAPATIA